MIVISDADAGMVGSRDSWTVCLYEHATPVGMSRALTFGWRVGLICATYRDGSTQQSWGTDGHLSATAVSLPGDANAQESSQ